MYPQIFKIRLRSGVLVTVRVLATSREQAALRVLQMYPGSTEHIEKLITTEHADISNVPFFLREHV
jgi:hypothetical protein